MTLPLLLGAAAAAGVAYLASRDSDEEDTGKSQNETSSSSKQTGHDTDPHEELLFYRYVNLRKIKRRLSNYSDDKLWEETPRLEFD
jgi:hypothetical protein